MNIIKYIKKIIKIKSYDLSFLNIGDIIWAKRYKSENQKNKIEKGHQESPYIIIKKYKNKVFALQCTSNPHQEIGWKILYYPLNRLQYNLDKNTYVGIRIVHELKNIQYVEKIGHLRDYDINKIKKYLFILKTSNYRSKPNIENKYINFKYEIGDIITFNDTKYYIEGIKFGYYITYRLRKRVKVDNNIIINNTYYSFIFEKQEKIKKSKNILLVDTFNTGEIKKINQYKISYLDSLNNKRNIKRILDIGVLVKYNNNLFYIYDKNEISYFAYRIYLSTEYKIGMLWLKINGGIFYTFLDRVELSKEKLETVGYKIKRQSTKEEIEDNSISFNIPKKKRNSFNIKSYNTRIINKKSDIDTFIPMVILKNKNNGMYYLILSKNNNIIEVVNINDNRDYFYFKLDEEACPFIYYRIISVEEFEIYKNKIQDIKNIAASFD